MKQLKHSRLLFLAVICVILSGCKKDDPTSCRPPASARRTVLVYLGTDNNFSAEAAQKIDTLKKYWDKTIDGNLLVYADAGKNPVLVHIYHKERQGNVADTIETYPAENSANPATLARALNKAKAYRPTASYGLVVLSHGSGWLPAEMSDPISIKSIILDKNTNEANKYMELSDFAEAIPYKLDFIIFDACFMGSIEVCYELKDKADYIVASPAEVLAPGFVYTTMVRHMFAPIPDLTAVAREFYEYYDNQSGMSRSATVSVVKTSEMEALATVVKNLTQQNTLADNLENIQTYGFGAQKIYFDLGDYLQKLSPENSSNIQAALDKCVIYKACTPKYYSAATGQQTIYTFSGLSLYIPQAAYPAANEAYKKLKWTARTGLDK